MTAPVLALVEKHIDDAHRQADQIPGTTGIVSSLNIARGYLGQARMTAELEETARRANRKYLAKP